MRIVPTTMKTFLSSSALSLVLLVLLVFVMGIFLVESGRTATEEALKRRSRRGKYGKKVK